MNIYALISLVAFMTCFFLGNFIYHKNPKSHLNIMVAVLCILVGFLAFTEFEYRQAETFQIAYSWLKISTLWPLVPSVLLHISLIFTKSQFLKNKLIYILIYLPSISIISLSLTTNLLLDGILREYWGWTYNFPQNPILFGLMSFWTLFAGLLAAFLCFKYFLKSKNIKRQQAKYMLVGLYLPLTISLLSDLILPNISVRVPEMTMTMSTIGISFISYGIWKYRFPALTTAIAADKIVSTMSNFFVLLDENKNIVNINKSTTNLSGYSSDELIGRSIKTIIPDVDIFSFNGINLNPLMEGSITNIETMFKTKYGSLIPVFLSISLIQSNDSKTLGIVCIGSDIIDIKQAEYKIRASLEEKELLLREVHHRVKNNLQIISSLLNLQADHIKDKEDLELFKDSQGRVKSMAFIHEQLYHSSDFKNIDFAEYIHNLVTYLTYSYTLNPEIIKINVDVENVSLNLNTAIPCGLIINELVTNSIRYAFPNGRIGIININLHSYSKDKYILIINDNGIGLSSDIDFENTKTLGLQLVDGLTKQLEGSVELNRNNGTEFKIIFNKLKYKKRI